MWTLLNGKKVCVFRSLFQSLCLLNLWLRSTVICGDLRLLCLCKASSFMLFSLMITLASAGFILLNSSQIFLRSSYGFKSMSRISLTRELKSFRVMGEVNLRVLGCNYISKIVNSSPEIMSIYSSSKWLSRKKTQTFGWAWTIHDVSKSGSTSSLGWRFLYSESRHQHSSVISSAT